MSNFYLGNHTQRLMDEYLVTFYKLDNRAGLSEAEGMPLLRIPPCTGIYQ